MKTTETEMTMTLADVRFTGLLDFSSTSVSVEACTDRAKRFFTQIFGTGAVSATLPKSRAEDFERFVGQHGMTVEVQ